MVIGDKGEVVNTSFLDYKLPTALDIPEVIPVIVEAQHKEGPWGSKGIGEMPVFPVAPAIANALYDAVGVGIKDLPLTRIKFSKLLRRSINLSFD